ncbi:MAG: hypothetical protein U0Q15_02510 [Kineosporiaceae bacterium]
MITRVRLQWTALALSLGGGSVLAVANLVGLPGPLLLGAGACLLTGAIVAAAAMPRPRRARPFERLRSGVRWFFFFLP